MANKKIREEEIALRRDKYLEYIAEKERDIRDARDNELRVRRVNQPDIEQNIQEVVDFGKRLFEKDIEAILYQREDFTIEEKLYDAYIEMRKNMNKLEKFKYGIDDPMLNSEEFKQGFIAGIKIMSSLLIDV